MSSPSEKVSSLIASEIKRCHVFISGRIDSSRRFDGRHFTRMVLPAIDEYSSPGVVEVESISRLGDVGENWKGTVVLSGFRNDYKSSDKETGELRSIKGARNTLKAIE